MNDSEEKLKLANKVLETNYSDWGAISRCPEITLDFVEEFKDYLNSQKK
jgi:hypothetical protein